MKIAKNAVVVLRYEVEVEGQIVDRMTEERPLDYIHGTNMLLPRFEQEIEGREEGYEFAFSASPEEGYGEYDPANVVEIPKTAFMVDGKLHDEILVKGRFIPMFNGAGEVVHGQVMEVKEEVVVMDFNHPMAGKTLNFSGKVLQVREATEKELQEGLHGEFLPQEEHECHCHKGEGGCHGEGHKDGECCHGEGHKDGECCHGEGKKDGECCHGNGDCHKE